MKSTKQSVKTVKQSAKTLMIATVILVVLVGGYFFCDKLLTSKKSENTPKVLSLTIDSATINNETTNNHLNINGTVNLSINEEIYQGASLSGYCLDLDNQRHNIYGPQDGRALFHNGSNELSLSEVLTIGGIDIDWENFTIKYCKIDTLSIYPTDIEKTVEEVTLNYEKSFN